VNYFSALPLVWSKSPNASHRIESWQSHQQASPHVSLRSANDMCLEAITIGRLRHPEPWHGHD
jgi:hypothetical protein